MKGRNKLICFANFLWLLQIHEGEEASLGDPVTVKCLPWTEKQVRFVAHVDISSKAIVRAVDKLQYVLQELS